jgi:hypothetical protein
MQNNIDSAMPCKLHRRTRNKDSTPVSTAIRSVNPRRDTIVRLLRGKVAAGPGTDVQAVLAEQLLAVVTEQCVVRLTALALPSPTRVVSSWLSVLRPAPCPPRSRTASAS